MHSSPGSVVTGTHPRSPLLQALIPPPGLTGYGHGLPRIKRHEGEEFRTKEGLIFTYQVDGRSLCISRDGRYINRRLNLGGLRKAIERCPLARVTDVKDVINPSYVFGLLMDPRIRATDW